MSNSAHRVNFRRHISDASIQSNPRVLRKFRRSQSVYNLPDPDSSISRSNSVGSAWSLSESTDGGSSAGNSRKLRKRGSKNKLPVEGVRFSMTPCLSGDIDAVDGSGRSLLFYAVRYGQEGPTKLLLEAGCFINQQDNSGLTPLHETIGRGNVDIATILLDEGRADPNIGDHVGETPMLMAISLGRLDAVKLLHKYGADINKCDATGDSPLCRALSKGWSEIVEFLLDKRCDVNRKLANGNTCFYSAVNSDKLEACAITKRLLKTDYDFKQDSEWLGKDDCLQCLDLDSKLQNKVLERAGLKNKSRRRSILSSGKRKLFKSVRKFSS